MCQLSLAHMGRAKSNIMYLQFQGWQNCVTTNRDGFGLFNGFKIAKSSMDFSTVINTGSWLKYHVGTSDKPVIFHVRFATPVNGKKNVDDSSSHPFESENFVLAHNGVLELKVADPAYKDYQVDSQIYLAELEKAYVEEKNVAKAIDIAISKFYGTFAFLIFCKPEETYYVVRGKTKLLHFANVYRISGYDEKNEPVLDPYGFAVNTDAGDLDRAIYKYRAFEEMLSNVHIRFDKATLLKAETIYKIEGKTLVEVGVATESDRPKAEVIVPIGGRRQDGWVTKVGRKNDFLISPVPYLQEIRTALVKLELTVSELDAISYSVFNTGILGLTDPQWKILATVTLKKLETFHTGKKASWWTFIKLYCPITMDGAIDSSMAPYSLYNIEFPYMLNSAGALEKIARKLKGEDNDKSFNLLDLEEEYNEEDLSSRYYD